MLDNVQYQSRLIDNSNIPQGNQRKNVYKVMIKECKGKSDFIAVLHLLIKQ